MVRYGSLWRLSQWLKGKDLRSPEVGYALTSLPLDSAPAVREEGLPNLTAMHPVDADGNDVCDDHAPVVLLLGWSGAVDQHLRNAYAKLYAQHGIRTVRGIANQWCALQARNRP